MEAKVNNEVKELAQDGNGRLDAIRSGIPALILILIGGGMLASNFLNLRFDEWWALFMLMPVSVLFYQVWRDYNDNGRLSSRSIGPLIGGLVLSAMVATFLFDLDWSQLWPVVFIFGGIAVLLRKRAAE